jgi:hypothetical protein
MIVADVYPLALAGLLVVFLLLVIAIAHLAKRDDEGGE